MTHDTIRSLLGDPATVEAMNDAYEDAYEAEVNEKGPESFVPAVAIDKAMRAAIAALERLLADAPAQVCTCHPDDNPPRPCPQKFAYSECVAAAPVAPGDEEIVEGIASILSNMNEDLKPDNPWGYRLIANSKSAEHDGDCTKKPYTCLQCLYLNETKFARNFLAAARPLLARQSTRRTDEEVEREIERRDSEEIRTKNYNAFDRAEAIAENTAWITALRWTLNKTEPGR